MNNGDLRIQLRKSVGIPDDFCDIRKSRCVVIVRTHVLLGTFSRVVIRRLGNCMAAAMLVTY